MQIALNSVHEDGKLIYATTQGFVKYKRNLETVTIHNNMILHGVAIHKKGIRYALFF